MVTGIFGPKRLGDWKGYAFRHDPQDDPLDEEEEMHPEVDEYRSNELAEQARWVAEAKAHTVAITCALIRVGVAPYEAARIAPVVYVRMEDQLAKAAGD